MTILDLLRLIRKHIALVIVLPIVCAVLVGLYSVFLMPDKYTATTSMYVLVKQDSSSNSTMYSDLSASQMVSNDVATLLKSDRVAKQTADSLGLSSISDYDVSVDSSTTSRVITLSVTGTSASTAADIANGMVDAVSSIASSVMNVEGVNSIDEAVAPSSPSGPNRVLYTAVAFLAGLFVAIAIVVLADTLNTKVRDHEDVEALTGLPVVGRIPVAKEAR
ncbi:MAG: Wzz/FepE/Etk N-terminal domain-containing protein [Coriobacteriales bacterium]|jgi:capsular polysaccharide biosynthesis protein